MATVKKYLSLIKFSHTIFAMPFALIGFVLGIIYSSENPINPPKLTIWPSGGHDAWTRAVNPDYKENGKNIYEWMLQYTK